MLCRKVGADGAPVTRTTTLQARARKEHAVTGMYPLGATTVSIARLAGWTRAGR
jgi:hypothetical protein